jgi:ABC-type transport system involved in cytochrome c biogenesis permease component
MIGRSQSVENSPGTKTSVTMLGLDPAGVFLGKAMALLFELAVTTVVLLAGVVLFLRVPLHGALVGSPSILLTIATLSVAGTLYGAIASGVDGPATLLPVLALPAFAPLLIAGERSFASAVNGGDLARWLVILILALIVYVAIGIILYGALEESS